MLPKKITAVYVDKHYLYADDVFEQNIKLINKYTQAAFLFNGKKISSYRWNNSIPLIEIAELVVLKT